MFEETYSVLNTKLVQWFGWQRTFSASRTVRNWTVYLQRCLHICRFKLVYISRDNVRTQAHTKADSHALTTINRFLSFKVCSKFSNVGFNDGLAPAAHFNLCSILNSRWVNFSWTEDIATSRDTRFWTRWIEMKREITWFSFQSLQYKERPTSMYSNQTKLV